MVFSIMCAFHLYVIAVIKFECLTDVIDVFILKDFSSDLFMLLCHCVRKQVVVTSSVGYFQIYNLTESRFLITGLLILK